MKRVVLASSSSDPGGEVQCDSSDGEASSSSSREEPDASSSSTDGGTPKKSPGPTMPQIRNLSWNQLQSLEVDRTSGSICTLNGFIYFFGLGQGTTNTFIPMVSMFWGLYRPHLSNFVGIFIILSQ